MTGPAESARPEPEFDRRMLEVLVCPVTRGPLAWHPETLELVSEGAGLAFPVRGGVPIMLVDEARPLRA